MLFNHKEKRNEEGNCEYTLYVPKRSKVPDSMPDNLAYRRIAQRLVGHKRLDTNNIDLLDPEAEKQVRYYSVLHYVEDGYDIETDEYLLGRKIEEDVVKLEHEEEAYNALIDEYEGGSENEE